MSKLLKSSIISGILGASIIMYQVGAAMDVPKSVGPTETFAYEITGIENGSYYGKNTNYHTYPGIYFTDKEFNVPSSIETGEWVLATFQDDELIQIDELEGN